METDPTRRPIGYWLKHLHDLLEDGFAADLADLGVDRRQWQALHTLAGGPLAPDGLAAALAPFWPDARAGVDSLLHGPAGLVARGWAEPAGGGAVRLTDAGHDLHGVVETRVAELRTAVLAGLTRDQYAETVGVLAVMADNLERRAGRSG
ncbi:MarR family transcriptional regulator [Kitasatospora sp. DSM 101779]|uniref:MarR family transcriptional regulator n=1 Tax=Kitasatospora sp. DSM 101779 TaxID=2853165 RepID=UPI0021D95F5D|nr:MarR family transcriptional regulator [Kitasatospora sp. DSM 101779]MCU7824048.1 MarR family transcriptional regulator [Kitasatospora sp. DSM 101779]